MANPRELLYKISLHYSLQFTIKATKYHFYFKRRHGFKLNKNKENEKKEKDKKERKEKDYDNRLD